MEMAIYAIYMFENAYRIYQYCLYTIEILNGASYFPAKQFLLNYNFRSESLRSMEATFSGFEQESKINLSGMKQLTEVSHTH